MIGYTETLDRMAEKVGGQVLAAFESWQAGRITEGEFVAVVAAFLTAADSRATALADTALAAFLSAATGRPVAALGTVPPDLDHRPRIGELVAAGAAGEQWRSYGRGSALARAQDAYSEAMTARQVPGWTRQVNQGACALCRDLAGTVLPGDVPMYHHKGCGCVQRPVLHRQGETA